MTDQLALAKATDRASRADRLLGDDLLKEAFKALEDGYIAAWRATTVDDVSGREKLFLAINVIGKVRDHLNGVIAGGKLASAELEELRKVSERKKRFGIV